MFLIYKLFFLSLRWFSDLVDIVFGRFYHQMYQKTSRTSLRSEGFSDGWTMPVFVSNATDQLLTWKTPKNIFSESRDLQLENAAKFIENGSQNLEKPRFLDFRFFCKKKRKYDTAGNSSFNEKQF